LLFLPAYSPDLNPIEESFSALKHYLRRIGLPDGSKYEKALALVEATGHCITPEKADSWFRHAGYIW
ncbi:hypothetical protein PENSPDRAFT_594795, partial [Peniophora sp. CONT]